MTPAELAVIEDMLTRYVNDARAFVEEIIGAVPDKWQAEALDALSNEPRISIRAGHGVGKTAFESWAMLWFLFTRPHCRVVATAPTARQLNNILWSELGKWMTRAPIIAKYFEWQKTKVVSLEAPEIWYAVAATASKPENLAGFHEFFILFIVDEASGVSDEIFEVVEGALTTAGAKLLLCGNPTKTSGEFYDSFHRSRDLYWTKRVRSTDSKNASKEYAERMAKKYGKDSDVYRVRVDGEFPKAEPDQFIPLEIVEAATMRDVAEIGDDGEPKLIGPLEMGVDVARFGDDETTIYTRIGTHVFPPETFRNIDTVATAANTVRIAKEYMQKYNRISVSIKVDDTGVGGGVTDNLRLGTKDLKGQWSIVPCNFGGAGDDHCDDAATIMYDHVRDLLQKEEIHLPDDDDTIAQLTTRKYSVTAKGKLKLESKKEYKARTGLSPDRADALVLCFRPAIAIKAATEVRAPKKRSPLRDMRSKRF